MLVQPVVLLVGRTAGPERVASYSVLLDGNRGGIDTIWSDRQSVYSIDHGLSSYLSSQELTKQQSVANTLQFSDIDCQFSDR